jgi:hypothetical protein
MATLKLPFGLNSLWRGDYAIKGDSRLAREFTLQAYKKTGGPTAELKRVYGAYLDNERRRKTGQRKG